MNVITQNRPQKNFMNDNLFLTHLKEENIMPKQTVVHTALIDLKK